MPRRRLLFVLLALALAAFSFGCFVTDSGPERTQPPPVRVRDEAEGPVEDVDFSHLNGRWASETTLIDIDNEEFWFLGDKPSAQWECTVNGAEMQMQTVDNLYTGVLKPRGDTQWVYEGLAQYTDEDGASWTSTMLINAVQQDDDHFSGEFEASIDSDADGHLYTGRWEFTAERME
ncbi:MAG: hypothetical protein EG823_05745 [Actinobacteria bacterium]|nr:hypothetical protein [Actinomycetota bacterium]